MTAGRGLVLVCLTLLSGCSWVSGWFGSSSSAPARVIKEAAACPSAVILRPLSQTAVFGADQPHQPAGVAFYGALSEVTSDCDRSGDSVRLKLDVVVVGERGPAAAKYNAIDLSYFVAVTGPDQAILGKRQFPVRITIPDNAKRAAISDHIEETIGLGGRTPGDLSIVVGFQQSPEAVEFYRQYRGR
jgi:hypothetical protein